MICLATSCTIHVGRPLIEALTFRVLRHPQALERLLFRCIIRNTFPVHIACYVRHYLEIRVASYIRKRSVMMTHFNGIKRTTVERLACNTNGHSYYGHHVTNRRWLSCFGLYFDRLNRPYSHCIVISLVHADACI